LKFKIAFKCNCLSVIEWVKTYLFALLISISCLSQNKQILYNFTAVPQSLMTNPVLMSVINFILVFHCCRVFLLVLDRVVFSLWFICNNGGF
jgi:hypothetical protein